MARQRKRESDKKSQSKKGGEERKNEASVCGKSYSQSRRNYAAENGKKAIKRRIAFKMQTNEMIMQMTL